MNDRHEQSRAAFETGYFPSALQRDDNKWAWYSDREVQRQWEAWCRALDYAAEQQAKQDCVYCGGKSPISTATQREPETIK